jgi:hypothetical protein
MTKLKGKNKGGLSQIHMEKFLKNFLKIDFVLSTFSFDEILNHFPLSCEGFDEILNH